MKKAAHAAAVIMLALYLLMPAALASALNPAEKMSNPTLEARAQGLYQALRCVTCESQSIAESNAEMALALRRLIREKLAEGARDRDILSYVQSRYGDRVLMKPPFRPFTWVLWLAPVLALAGGGVMAARLFRRAAA